MFLEQRPNNAVNVSRAPPSRDIVAPSSGCGLNSLVKSEERNDSVYTNLSVPSNYARDSGQERQDSLQHPVSHNNNNVSLAEGRTASWDQNDDETAVPVRSFILNSVLNRLETKHIAVEKLTYRSFGSSNVTQSGLRNLHEVNLSSSIQVQ